MVIARVACRILFGALTVIASVSASEAHLDLPDPLIPGVLMEGAIVVEQAPGNIVSLALPEVAGLQWEQHGTKRTITTVNGVTSESFYFGVTAAELGTLDIPPATVRLSDGTSVSTAPITVMVSHGNAKLVGDAYAEAVFAPDTIVTGESTQLTYRIFVKPGCQVDKGAVSPPADAIRLSEPNAYVRGRSYDESGEAWTSFTTTWQLTWTKPGSYEVGGQQSYLRIAPDGFRRSVRSVAVKPARITVTPPPSEGRPADFAGLIGPVALTASLERSRIAAGEGTAIEVALAGPHVDLARAPELSLPAIVKSYQKETVIRPGGRVFRWDLVPAAPGEYPIPAISTAYFDVASRTYQRASSAPMVLTVLPGRASMLTVSGAPMRVAPSASQPAMVEMLPLRDAAQAVPAPGIAAIAFAVGLGLGGAAALARRIGPLRRAPHRGKALARAISARDLDAVARAIAQLRPELRDARLIQVAQRLQDAVDVARFGHSTVPDDIIASASELESVP
ncbi:MAG: BatD family protein [Planctomycetes bacterium]|nr:BatD family protein [Planctomycetota bacterium]